MYSISYNSIQKRDVLLSFTMCNLLHFHIPGITYSHPILRGSERFPIQLFNFAFMHGATPELGLGNDHGKHRLVASSYSTGSIDEQSKEYLL